MVVFLWTFRGRFCFQRVEHHRGDSMGYFVCHAWVSEGAKHSGGFPWVFRGQGEFNSPIPVVYDE